ncbi:MAG: phosphotransferase [Thermodesulfobacteriota bacterium]
MNTPASEKLARFIDSPDWQGPVPVRVEPLLGDASTRTYARMHYANGRTEIVSVAPKPGDQSVFLEVQGFLAGLGLPVPGLIQSDQTKTIVVQEDLGDDLLEYALRGATESELAGLYQQAVDLLVELRKATDGLDTGCGSFDLAFDEEKLMWEMEFFLTHFVGGLSKSDPTGEATETLRRLFRVMCAMLAAEPRVFAHRDYHARNLIVHNGRLRMIDFQDARMGPAQYDLASLLRDSYVTVPEPLVDSLIRRYFEAATHPRNESFERFRYVFDVMSLQRNIKALGTFGYQASVRGSTRYLSAIPRTAGHITRNMARLDDFSDFRWAVEDCICTPAFRISTPAVNQRAELLQNC